MSSKNSSTNSFSELEKSLAAINKMQRSSSTSVVLMLLGMVIIIGSLIFSVSKLAPLEAQIKEKQEQIAQSTKDIEDLEKKKNLLTLENEQLLAKNTILKSRPIPVDTNDSEKIRVEENTTFKIASIAPRVYIHIKDKSQEAKAKTIAAKLEEKGYIVPGIEIVGKTSPKNDQLRYFQQTDLEKKDIQQLFTIFQAISLEVKTEFISGYEKSKQIRPRHYELWLA